MKRRKYLLISVMAPLAVLLWLWLGSSINLKIANSGTIKVLTTSTSPIPPITALAPKNPQIQAERREAYIKKSLNRLIPRLLSMVRWSIKTMLLFLLRKQLMEQSTGLMLVEAATEAIPTVTDFFRLLESKALCWPLETERRDIIPFITSLMAALPTGSAQTPIVKLRRSKKTRQSSNFKKWGWPSH